MRYEELADRADGPPGTAWGLFGADDEVGTINHLTPERILDAIRLVRKGTSFNLDYPVDAFSPGIGHRPAPTHTIFQRNDDHRDDYLDRLYLQASSQIDGLRHFRHPTLGFYNGVPDHQVTSGSPALGVNRWAEHGIVGRGVLLDLVRHRDETGRSDDDDAWAVDVDDLDGAALSQGVEIRPGDILMLRTGWAVEILDRMQAGDFDVDAPLRSPGLRQAHDVVAWLWDHQIALVAADNLAVEVFPSAPDSPFRLPSEREGGPTTFHTGMMHRIVIPLLGMALGELWNLEALTADCVDDGVWDCLVVAKPLFVTGGVGTPANALALK